MVTEIKEAECTPLFYKTRDCKARTVVNVGGSGSSKSWSIAQLLVYKLISEEGKQFAITRKTMPALKRSSYDLIVKFLQEYGIYPRGKHNKTDHIFRFKQPHWKNESAMMFFGLDEPTKVKSISGGVNYIWLEEADEFTYDDYMMFKLQLRKETGGEPNQIFLSFNPIDGGGWIPTKLINEDDVEVIHSTIDDNPCANKDYVKDLKSMVDKDENYYRVYVLGEWGRLEDLVFPNYVLIDALPTEFDAWCYGLDFGYVHPTALIKVLQSQQKLYWHECICESGLTNSDLIERLGHLDKGDIYADNAEPNRIEEIFRAGHNIYPANKDVKLGIDVCRRQPIHITKESVTLIKQIRGYQRKKNKDGIVLEEPVKIRDDTLDAGRYGTLGITERFGFATAMPGGSEPRTSDPGFRF